MDSVCLFRASSAAGLHSLITASTQACMYIQGRPAFSITITERAASSEKKQSSFPLAAHLSPARLQRSAVRWLAGTSVSAVPKTVCLF